MSSRYYKWERGTVCNECETISSTAGINTCPKCGLMDAYRWVSVEYAIFSDDVKFQTGWIREKKDKDSKIHRVWTFRELCQ